MANPWDGFTGQGYGMTKPMQLPSNQGGFGGMTKPMQVQPDYSNMGTTGGNMYQPPTRGGQTDYSNMGSTGGNMYSPKPMQAPSQTPEYGGPGGNMSRWETFGGGQPKPTGVPGYGLSPYMSNPGGFGGGASMPGGFGGGPTPMPKYPTDGGGYGEPVPMPKPSVGYGPQPYSPPMQPHPWQGGGRPSPWGGSPGLLGGRGSGGFKW